MYFKYEAERSEINHSGDIYPVVSSTPMKIVENTEEFETLTIKDDSKDHDFSVESWVADGSGEEEETTSQEQNYIKEPKYIIVFESSIEYLINKLKCNICECPVDSDSTIKDLSDGTVVTYTVCCTSGHIIIKWSFYWQNAGG